MSEEHVHRARWNESPVGVRLRRHQWSTLLVSAIVLFGFGSWRLIRGEADQTAPQSATGGVQQPGVRSVVRIDPDGSLRIVQRLVFATPRSTMTVSIPLRSAPDNLFDPRVGHVRLSVSGHAVPGPSGTLRKGQAYTFQLPSRSASAELRYAVEGATYRSRPSVPERVLALATPLTIEQASNLTSWTEVDGQGVLNVGCKAPGGTMTTCGTSTKRGWVVERGAGDSVDVFAQVNLPAAPRS